MAPNVRTEAFLDLVLADMAGLAAAVMAAVGDRQGLVRALAEAGPMTADELGGLAGIHPRYAREWSCGMTAAGYLHHDAGSDRFSLPPEHIPVVAEEAGPRFVGGTLAMMVGMLGVIPRLEGAFRTGAGIPMEAYGEDVFRHGERDMAGVYRNRLVSEWIPAMPAVRERLEAGVSVADVGCGGGLAIVVLAKAFPRSRFVGYDVFPPNVGRATAAAADAGVGDRTRFVACDAAKGLAERHDLVFTFDVVHDATDPSALLHAIREALPSEGRYVILEPRSAEELDAHGRPIDVVRYLFSLLYCMSTSLATEGAALGTLGTPEGVMRRLCSEAGFRNFRAVPVGGIHALYEATA
ncbi:MAG TPA: class I SAM-dependent methyltransferase [Candidatus Dormibacteraeota bacterium]